MITKYARVTFRSLTSVWGFSTKTFSVKHGVSLTRRTEDGRDDLLIEKAGKPVCEVPWANVGSAEPIAAVSELKRGPGRPKAVNE